MLGELVAGIFRPVPSNAAPILDSHTHAWQHWPYSPAVPDPDSRGRIEQLLREMDANGVEQAAVVCAAIEGNDDNVAYVASAVERWPDRLHLFADLDCPWSASYHRPGAPGRLTALCDRYNLAGFTHYVDEQNDRWLASAEAFGVFTVAAERDLVVSLAAGPSWQADLRRLALAFPTVPVLCHHLAGLSARQGPPSAAWRQVLASADVPSVLVKASGFHYSSARSWDAPWPDVTGVLEALLKAFGAHRLCWGSDFPASTRYCTYRQSLEAVRSHCPFLAGPELAMVLGGTLGHVLRTRRPPAA